MNSTFSERFLIELSPGIYISEFYLGQEVYFYGLSAGIHVSEFYLVERFLIGLSTGIHVGEFLMEIKKKKRMRLKFKMLKDTLAHHPLYLKGLQGAKLRS